MADGASAMRIDRFLWFARLARTRSAAQGMAVARHLRIDGRVIDKAAAHVRVGDTLTFPLHDRIRVIRIEALPARRGPAPEARACYTDLVATAGAVENVSQESASD
ncbi:MAG: RNA-binding S4 domain-containing protein [Pseudomonadota bacterium]